MALQKATITTGAAGEVVVSKPTFSREAGTYYSPFNLELKTGTTGAAIHYTLDGTDPTTNSAKYSAPIAITANTTVKAITALNGKVSDIATAAYVMGVATEVANIAAYQAVADETQVKFANPVTVLAQTATISMLKTLLATPSSMVLLALHSRMATKFSLASTARRPPIRVNLNWW